jgi:hypothetical protein
MITNTLVYLYSWKVWESQAQLQRFAGSWSKSDGNSPKCQILECRRLEIPRFRSMKELGPESGSQHPLGLKPQRLRWQG